MKLADLCWAAGIFDGEGCVTVTKQKGGTGGRVNPSHRLYAKVTMGHKPTVERLKEIFGVGTITIQRHGHFNDAWTWWVAARQAESVLKIMRPHLFTKAEEADLALEFAALPPRTGSRISPELLAERERLFCALRDAKPSARFRRAA